jgi:hypothetical protein
MFKEFYKRLIILLCFILTNCLVTYLKCFHVKRKYNVLHLKTSKTFKIFAAAGNCNFNYWTLVYIKVLTQVHKFIKTYNTVPIICNLLVTISEKNCEKLKCKKYFRMIGLIIIYTFALLLTKYEITKLRDRNFSTPIRLGRSKALFSTRRQNTLPEVFRNFLQSLHECTG